MDIPLIEPVVGDAELDRIEAVIDSGYLTQGPVATEFEDRFTQVTDADHAVTTTSCTTGMELALQATGIGPGDEVVVPDFTYPATALSVNRVGATPVLVDVDRQTFNISIEQTRDAISEDTAALLPVSWGGQPLDPSPIRELAATHDLAVIEDAACSAGAAFDDEPVGSQFDASVFSLHPRKVITTGEGGVVTTDDDDLERELRSLKNFGTDPSGDHEGFRRSDATNYRMSDLLAAVGVSQLDKLDKIIGTRRRLASRYDDLLADIEGVRTPHVPTEAEHVFQSYCVYIEAGEETLRDQLMDVLAAAGIETQIGTYAVHRTDAFADAKRTGSLETSSALYDSLLTLPMAHSMDDDQQQRVVDTLRSELRSQASTV